MDYSIEDHKHREAAWVASTSARASSLCRFPVKIGLELLESVGFDSAFSSPDGLPSPSRFDAKHKEWRDRIVAEAGKLGRVFSHGVAAKLINCYLKARFVCGGYHGHQRVQYIHPPIDAILLGKLAEQDVGGFRSEWQQYRNARWSKYDSETYQDVIDLIRKSMPGRPLWEIEKYWPGYQ